MPENQLNQNSKNKVLIIDDQKLVHDALMEILRPEYENSELDEIESELFSDSEVKPPPLNFAVDSAFQGEDGYKMILEALNNNDPYDIVFVDIRMPPGWDGLKTINKILETESTAHLIICTAYSDYTFHEILSQVGARDNIFAIQKPFTEIEILQLTSSLVQKIELERKNLTLTNKLLKSNHELEEMIRITSHDLKEPLINITGFLAEVEKVANSAINQLGADEKSKLNKEITSSTGEINKNINVISTRIDSLFELSTILHRKPDFCNIDMNKMLEIVLSNEKIKPHISECNINVEELPQCMSDETLLQQLLVVTVHNAIKFKHPERKPEITVSGEQNEEFSVYKVSDNGIGIPSTCIHKIFSLFYKSNPQTNHEDGVGVGVGLSIAKSIVNKLEGSIEVTSTSEQGSTFAITLPLSRK